MTPKPTASQIYWDDPEADGIVYYANYLRFLERGRSDLVRRAGIDRGPLLDSKGVMFPVCRCDINYLQPALLDKILHIHTPNTALGSTTIWGNNSSATGANLACLTIQVRCIEPTRQVVRFLKALRAACEHFHAMDALLAREEA